jgi:hypothetical protein
VIEQLPNCGEEEIFDENLVEALPAPLEGSAEKDD